MVSLLGYGNVGEKNGIAVVLGRTEYGDICDKITE